MREQLAGDALAATGGGASDVQDLHVAFHHHAAGHAQQLAVIVRDPPGAGSRRRGRELLQKERRRPRLVARALKADGLERSCSLSVGRTHGAELQVTAGQLVGHAGLFGVRALAQAQTAALVFLRVRKARVDRQHQRRVAVARTTGKHQTLTRRPPQLTLDRALHLGLVEQLAIAHQAVAGELHAIPVGVGSPLVKGLGSLDHALALKLAMHALLVQLVERRIDLTAHGVCRHAQQAALARAPRRPSAGIESRGAQQRHVGTASKALCR